MRQTYAPRRPSASPVQGTEITATRDPEIPVAGHPGQRYRATTAVTRTPSFPVVPFLVPQETRCSAPPFAPSALASAGCATAGVALAADGPVTQDPGAQVSRPPTGTRQIVLRAQSFHVIDHPPRRSHNGPPSPGDASITRYRVLDPAGTRIGSAQFVCVATDRRGQHEQCSGTIALPDGQIATQGDADNMAVVGGSRSYAGARGTVTGRDHPDSVDVTIQFMA